MRFLGLDRAWRAGLMLAVCVLISAAAAAAVRSAAHPLLLRAYSQRFSFMPGHWFGERVAVLSGHQSPSCVILGASNAREGFDPEIIEAATPGILVVNAATTGGNNEVLEVQSAILKHNRIRPRCVIAGISTWSMFRNGSPLITAEEYLGLMDWDDVLGLSAKPLLSKEGPRIVFGLVLPLRGEAKQLNRVARSAIKRVRQASIGALPDGRYETHPGELKPADNYLYLHTAPHLVQDWAKLVERSRPWYFPSRYGGQLQERSLRTTLNRLLGLSPDVLLVITPQTPILSPASRAGSPYFWEVIESYRGRITLVDCSGFRDLSLFIDEGHLGAQGRAQMSAEVGQILRDRLAGRTLSPTAHCMVVG